MFVSQARHFLSLDQVEFQGLVPRVKARVRLRARVRAMFFDLFDHHRFDPAKNHQLKILQTRIPTNPQPAISIVFSHSLLLACYAKSNQIFQYTFCITPKQVTSFRCHSLCYCACKQPSFFRRNVAAASGELLVTSRDERVTV